MENEISVGHEVENTAYQINEVNLTKKKNK